MQHQIPQPVQEKEAQEQAQVQRPTPLTETLTPSLQPQTQGFQGYQDVFPVDPNSAPISWYWSNGSSAHATPANSLNSASAANLPPYPFSFYGSGYNGMMMYPWATGMMMPSATTPNATLAAGAGGAAGPTATDAVAAEATIKTTEATVTATTGTALVYNGMIPNSNLVQNAYDQRALQRQTNDPVERKGQRHYYPRYPNNNNHYKNPNRSQHYGKQYYKDPQNYQRRQHQHAQQQQHGQRQQHQPYTDQKQQRQQHQWHAQQQQQEQQPHTAQKQRHQKQQEQRGTKRKQGAEQPKEPTPALTPTPTPTPPPSKKKKIDIRAGSVNYRAAMSVFKSQLYARAFRNLNDPVKEKQNGKKLLDLACGDGNDLYKYKHENVRELTMVDCSATCIERIQEKLKGNKMLQSIITSTKVHQCDLRFNVLQFSNPQMDAVTCMLALHYFWGSPDHIHTFLSTVEHSLRPGGVFVVLVADADKLLEDGFQNHPFASQSPIYTVIVPTRVVSVPESLSLSGETSDKDSKASKTTPSTVIDLTDVPTISSNQIPSKSTIPTIPIVTKASPNGGQSAINDKQSIQLVQSSQPTQAAQLPAPSTQLTRRAYRYSFTGVIDNLEEFVVPRDELIDMCKMHGLQWEWDVSVQDMWEDMQRHFAKIGGNIDLNNHDWQILNTHRAYVFRRAS